MKSKKKLRVTLAGTDYSYSVIITANEKMTMKQIRDIVVKEVKKKYDFDIPQEEAFDLEFEVIGK